MLQTRLLGTGKLPKRCAPSRPGSRTPSLCCTSVQRGHGQGPTANTSGPNLDSATGLALTRRSLTVLGPLLMLQPGISLASTPGVEKVFVAGSTGNTGRRVVQELRRLGFSVRAGVRDTKKALALGFKDSGVEIVIADVLADEGLLAAAVGDAQAVICATGFSGLNPAGPGQVDERGTINLVNAARRQGVSKFVLVSSLLVNAPAVGQAENPNYKFLNLFGGVLDHKLAAEQYLRRSGLDYTIIRPGGLSNEPAAVVGNLIVRPEDSLFGLDSDPSRLISRDTVAAVAVQALLQPAASNKVVEVVASPEAPDTPPSLWFQ